MAVRLFLHLLFLCAGISLACGQNLAPPAPQPITIRSKILNEDRVMLVRMPLAAQGGKDRYPVLYVTDGGSNVNEIGSTIDFLADNNLMPPLIVVGITNTDRNRDLTQSHADVKESDGSVRRIPTSGGADKFLDFIQSELVPEIDKRYPTQPYRILVGHSLGGLFALHAMVARPALFNAYIASSPSLWWDDFLVLNRAQELLATQKEFKKTLFFTLGDEKGYMIQGFERLQKMLNANKPKGFVVGSAHYLDETHRTTELVSHYAGLRLIFSGWSAPRDPETGARIGGLDGIEQHYRELAERFGYSPSAEKDINSFGYAVLGDKKIDEALAAFRRNLELYPQSPNVYDSYADGLEAAGQNQSALENSRKAVELGTALGDPQLPDYQKHLDRLIAAAKPAVK